MSATIPADGVTIPEVENSDIVVASLSPAALAAESDMQWEPVVEKWSRRARLAFIAVATAGLWYATSRLWS